ncbi:ABC transporter ATP-binding protein [Mycobacterium haemophilum]|uniref:ABC transporter ATP-binding protein n=1 Tax=Mycobacterium haemophilum TaxID=29311 RepID=UPI0009E5E93B|nr:ABC transporter ATP-binding protein [Mycobacterium haemophilum]
MSARTAVELRDLAIGYRRRRRGTTSIAAGLHALAHRGELTALLGPNGCGKSTLIRTLCALQPALGGHIVVDGTDLARLAPGELARRVAVVLTDRIDPGLLSARELVGLGRIPHLGYRARLTSADHAVVDWALSAVEAQHLAARPAAELSDGELQRVLTARALAQQPCLLVLDEPTAFLDVSSRAGLVEMLRTLAREHDLAIVMSTHELELALRVADRVWLFDADGGLRDAIPEELMLAGHVGALFDRDTLRFDPAVGAFVFRGPTGRSARVEAADPLRAALQRVLSREGWSIREPAEIMLTATDSDTITLHTDAHSATPATLSTLPALLRSLPDSNRNCIPTAEAAAVLHELSDVGPSFAIGTGTITQDGWWPVQQLYTDTTLLDGIITSVQARSDAPDRRVAVSTFVLGFAARLWSIGVGALAGYQLVPDLAADQLMFREDGGQIRLHIEHPVAWRGDDLESMLANVVLESHITPLTAAVRQLAPISEKLLRGNAASALLGAARMFDRRHGDVTPGPAWQLAVRLARACG